MGTEPYKPLTIRLTRDSVCMADDMDAPHERSYEIAAVATVRDLGALVQQDRYLAPIAGGEAAWLLRIGDTDAAVLAQQWDAPFFIVDAGLELSAIRDAEGAVAAHVAYHGQLDPRVLADRFRPQGERIL